MSTPVASRGNATMQASADVFERRKQSAASLSSFPPYPQRQYSSINNMAPPSENVSRGSPTSTYKVRANRYLCEQKRSEIELWTADLPAHFVTSASCTDCKKHGQCSADPKRCPRLITGDHDPNVRAYLELKLELYHKHMAKEKLARSNC